MFPRIVLSWNFRPLGVGSRFEAPNAGRQVWWEISQIFRNPFYKNRWEITIRNPGWAVGPQAHVIVKDVCPLERVMWIEPWDIPPTSNYRLDNYQWGLTDFYHRR